MITDDMIVKSMPGSVFLVYMPGKEQEKTIRLLSESIIEKRRTDDACKAKMFCVDMNTNGDPAEFPDLGRLCSKLIHYAGFSSHFDGLVLLDISRMLTSADADRLKALGELLHMSGGLASRCVTVIYGPSSEKELIRAANLIDVCGRLQAGELSLARKRVSLEEMLSRGGMVCENSRVMEMMKEDIGAMKGEEFDCLCYLNAACTADGEITLESLMRMKQNPYSYYNRFANTGGQRENHSCRRMGFGE